MVYKIISVFLLGLMFIGCSNTQPNYVLDISTIKKFSSVNKFNKCVGDKDVCTVVNNVEDIYVDEIEDKLSVSCANFWKNNNEPLNLKNKKLNVDVLKVSMEENNTLIEVIFYINEKNEEEGCGIQQIIKLQE